MHRAKTDDERRHLLEQLKREFFLPPLLEHKYRLEQVIGEGSYGIVCSAVNTETGERVAVKRIMRVFEEVPEATRTLRELKFLRLLKDHENIITIKDVLLPSDRDSFDDVFVVLELMPTDLTRVLRSKIELSPEHIRWLVFQLIRGIYYIHTSRVFHRDLKPSNILINARCDLRIVDFGLSRAALDDDQPDLVFWTDYVATRWYRAPELIMAAATNYTTAIDMWSVGCIFAEMLNNGRPMFPGQNPEDQLRLIVNFCGTPDPAAIASVRESRARDLLQRMPPCKRKPLAHLFPNIDPLALDLLDKILEFDPLKRISAEDALRHPYLQMDTVTRGTPIDHEEFAFERRNPSISQLRDLFVEEILKYHPDRRHMYSRTSEQPVLRYAPIDQAARFREAMDANLNGTEPPRAWESLPNQRLKYYTHQEGGNIGVRPGSGAGGGGGAGAGGGGTSHGGTHGSSGGGGGGGGGPGGRAAAAAVMATSNAANGGTHSQSAAVRQQDSSTMGMRSAMTASTSQPGSAAMDDSAMQTEEGGGGGGGGGTVTVQVLSSSDHHHHHHGSDGRGDAMQQDAGMGGGGGMAEEAQLMRYAKKYSSAGSASSAMAFRHDSGMDVAGRRVSETVESMMEAAQEMLNDAGAGDGVSA